MLRSHQRDLAPPAPSCPGTRRTAGTEVPCATFVSCEIQPFGFFRVDKVSASAAQAWELDLPRDSGLHGGTSPGEEETGPWVKRKPEGAGWHHGELQGQWPGCPRKSLGQPGGGGGKACAESQ